MEKDIDKNYSISSDGRVYSKRRNMFLKPYCNTKKYMCVDIYKKSTRIHRLVAENFIPNPNNYEQINHIDGNKENNDISNLEWCSNRMNSIHYHKSESPGVSITKSGTYHTKIYLNKKQIYLGTFKTLQEANRAYSTALDHGTSF